MITFLTSENNNINIHSDPWKKSDRDSIRNSCDVLLILSILSIVFNVDPFLKLNIYCIICDICYQGVSNCLVICFVDISYL